jgi:hypothetical protein
VAYELTVAAVLIAAYAALHLYIFFYDKPKLEEEDRANRKQRSK